MSNKNEQAQFIQIILLLATVVATIIIFRLFAGSFDNQPSKFWVSLIAVIFAEVLTFGSSIWLGSRAGFDNKLFPYNLSLIGMITVYDVGVVLLTLLAITPINSEWIVSLHLLLLLGVAISLAAFHFGGGLVEQIETKDTMQRQVARSQISLIDDLVDRTSRLNCDGSDAIREAVSSVREDFEYASAESLPGSESVDNEINNQIGQLTGLIIAAENCGENEVATNATTAELIRKTEELKLSISKRDRIMLELRG